MNNIRIRVKMAEHGVKQWEVARALGISESVLSRKLRDELSEEEQEKIFKAIEAAQKLRECRVK